MKLLLILTLVLNLTTSYAFSLLDNYTPSNVESLEKAQEIFNSLNDNTKIFSQCFNRANVWGKEMHKDFGINSMKILIYYTDKFQDEVNDRWWFHIAPVILVNGERMVMDRGFTDGPVTTDEWERIFTGQNGRNIKCKKTDSIAEYYADKNIGREYCYIQFVNMYNIEPGDIEEAERSQINRNAWNVNELKGSAREAFRRWRQVINDIL